MLTTHNPQVSTIVFRAIREHLSAIEGGIKSYHADSSKFEDFDESIRRTRIAKCATAIIGSPTLSRLLSLKENVLESIALERRVVDDEALALLSSMVAATTLFVDVQANTQGSDDDALQESCESLAESVRAYRRFQNLPEEDDERAISDLFRGARSIGAGSAASRPHVGSRPAEESYDFEFSDSLPGDASEKAENGGEIDLVDPELLEVFREEAEDHINKIYAGLSELQKDPEHRDQIQAVRRAAHTFKGAAGAIGLGELSRLSHRMEDVLDELYAGGIALTPEHLGVLLETTDLLQDCCLGESGDRELSQKAPQLYAAYDALQGVAPSSLTDSATAGQGDMVPSEASTADAANPTASETTKTRATRSLRVPVNRLDDVCNVVGEIMINRTSLEQVVERLVQCVDELRPVLDRLRSVSQQLDTQYEVPALWSSTEAPWTRARLDSPDHQIDSQPEFDELELDRYTDFHLLSRSLAEATSDSSTISHQLSSAIGDFQSLLAQQNQLTRDAQSCLMQIRMVPFGSLTPRLSRALREVADRQQKKVELTVEGENTELDKTVLEELLDPLLHLLRNSVDHGVEPPDVREERGKPQTASVQIRVFHHGTQVAIEISDDGKGLDADRIRSGVVEGGYLDAAEAELLSSDELYSYIFIPGFSTAASVSEISGRGVGMDIVRCNIEKLNGRIEVRSKPGEGTTFTIRLPTTLGVTRALIAATKNETFAIPTHAVGKIVGVTASQTKVVDGKPMVKIDGVFYPLVRLDNHLEFASLRSPTEEPVTVAIARLRDGTVALSFDRILSTRDIVVKSLGSHLGHVRGLLGATVLGDGAVVPILDPAELTLSSQQKSYERPPCELPNLEWEDISVMIVDDSVSVRRAMSNLIQRNDWTPMTARDGLDALDHLENLKTPPHAILLDVEMPRMDGYELLATLRSKPEYERVPIIMVTSRAGDKHRRKAIELGATAYVVKPIQDDPLLQLIRRHIAQARK